VPKKRVKVPSARLAVWGSDGPVNASPGGEVGEQPDQDSQAAMEMNCIGTVDYHPSGKSEPFSVGNCERSAGDENRTGFSGSVSTDMAVWRG
jgi:hypothetical protein